MLNRLSTKTIIISCTKVISTKEKHTPVNAASCVPGKIASPPYWLRCQTKNKHTTQMPYSQQLFSDKHFWSHDTRNRLLQKGLPRNNSDHRFARGLAGALTVSSSSPKPIVRVVLAQRGGNCLILRATCRSQNRVWLIWNIATTSDFGHSSAVNFWIHDSYCFSRTLWK